jgi:hypothetical protein
MGCYQWDDSKNGPCGEVATKGGLCAKHYSAVQEETPTTQIPTAVVKWTPASIKKHMGQVKSSFNSKSEFVGGNNCQPHVHNYSNGGAHVKVGKKEHVFLSKADGSFIKSGWDEGVAAASERQPHLLLAMALVLAASATAGLGDQEIDKLIRALPTI